jgi:hypothetical protein
VLCTVIEKLASAISPSVRSFSNSFAIRFDIGEAKTLHNAQPTDSEQLRMESKGKSNPQRKTLVQRQAETTVRDPAAHSKHQITELDKTAQRSVAKRKACAEEIAIDKTELAHVEEQILSIQLR